MSQEAYVFPTSFAQERLWFLDQLVPNNAFYNIDTSLRLNFAVDPATLEHSLNEIVRRHETLRTTFKAVDGQPVQVVAPTLHVPLPVVDLRGLDEAAREAKAVALATADSQQAFDLARGPLLRATLLCLGDEDYVFLLTMHHIIADGWSLVLLFQELSDIYEAFGAGLPSPLPELPIQYADFAVWQRDWLRGEVLEEQLSYWRNQLRDLPVLQFPTDWPRPTVLSYEGSLHTLWLPDSLARALRDLGAREKTTLFMTVLAAFNVLLSRYTGQDDIAVGTPVANRDRAEIETLIGFFVNSLVLRTDLSGNPSFRDLLGRVRETALQAYAHQDLSFETLVEKLQPERDMSRNPLFQVTLQLFSDFGAYDEQQSNLFEGEALETEKGTANIDFALDLWEMADGIYGTIEYSTDLFTAATISRLANHFETLLESIVAHPDRRISELSILSDAEHEQLLVQWNRTEMQFPGDVCLHQLVEAPAERTPEALAVVCRDQSLTYLELDRRANQLARYLQGQGVGPEITVAVFLERSIEMVVALLAILKAGGAYLPLDPANPTARLAFMLRDAQPKLVLTQKGLLSSLPPMTTPCILYEDESDAFQRLSETRLSTRAASDHLAYVIYTSGSTGLPKGVMVTHAAICNHLLWMQAAFPLAADDRVLQKYSLSFDVSILEIFGTLLAGARLIIAGPGRHLDLLELVSLMNREAVTVLDLVPSMLAVLLEDPSFNESRSLRRVTCGGEVLPKDLVEKFSERMKIELNNIYGPTEATIGSTFHTCVPSEQVVPIGRPVANTQVYLLDRSLNPLPAGVCGEIYIGGDGLARGYLKRPDLTAERFIPHPFSTAPGARLYRTGDVGRHRADGVIEYLGRMDEQVKLRGYRIELAEIENCLRHLPGVKDALVLVREDEPQQRDEGAELYDALLALDEEEAERLFNEVSHLHEDEAKFLLVYETGPKGRKDFMMRKFPDFEILIRVQENFVRPPTESQRNWILQRALDEFADDVQHLDSISRRLVDGSARPEIQGQWRDSPAALETSQLTIAGQQVMQDWERPLMKAMTEVAAASHGDILEVGFGMGISATYLQERGVRSHTIIECNDGVFSNAEQWKNSQRDRDIRLVYGKWQDVLDQLETYDAIFFDTYPLSEEEFRETVINSVTFAENFFPTAARLLRPGGIFTYYTNEIDSFSRRHQRRLFEHFTSLKLSVVRSLKPPPDCHYWWADSMVVVSAHK
ncbi:MAG TPA: amino acid adenylation domain-containing protein [Pyrinomonadaceae bacterium]|jgi:amino acid adenylation domain-containing protein|nr:amino acid adenylation domain-containing protein [Pyrinomonadaceae bacterium]